MMKLPPDPDQFKYFRSDPPEVKLEAWKRLQQRLTVRDLAISLAIIVSSVAGALIALLGRAG